MDINQFKKIMPFAPTIWFDPLTAAMAEFNISSPARQAGFIATIAHESNQLHTLEENLNYSAEGLAKTWPSRYAESDSTPNLLAISLANNPIKIANNVYANRMGNGPEELGNGWGCRGFGPIQLTGKINHFSAAMYFNVDSDKIGEWLRTPEGGSRSAAKFWNESNCNHYADIGDFDGVCDIINRGRKTDKIGDSIGYADRMKYYALACVVLKVHFF